MTFQQSLAVRFIQYFCQAAAYIARKVLKNTLQNFSFGAMDISPAVIFTVLLQSEALLSVCRLV